MILERELGIDEEHDGYKKYGYEEDSKSEDSRVAFTEFFFEISYLIREDDSITIGLCLRTFEKKCGLLILSKWYRVFQFALALPKPISKILYHLILLHDRFLGTLIEIHIVSTRSVARHFSLLWLRTRDDLLLITVTLIEDDILLFWSTHIRHSDELDIILMEEHLLPYAFRTDTSCLDMTIYRPSRYRETSCCLDTIDSESHNNKKYARKTKLLYEKRKRRQICFENYDTHEKNKKYPPFLENISAFVVRMVEMAGTAPACKKVLSSCIPVYDSFLDTLSAT